MKMLIEIRAAEGGDDSKLFVGDLANAYTRLAGKFGWKCYVSDRKPSEKGFHQIVLTVEGNNLQRLHNEAGGHRIQRVPPTERNGRVHTSTVTVAVIDPQRPTNDIYLKRSESDFNVEWYSGSGSGGQHRNKHMNSCRLTHLPTNTVRTAQTRTRQSSYKDAMDSLTTHLDQLYNRERRQVFDEIRKDQMGSGMRGDKTRTYRFRDDRVEDHQTGKGASCKKVMSGNFDLLWS